MTDANPRSVGVGGQPPTGLVEHRIVDAGGQTTVLGRRHELGGTEHAPVGVGPPGQGLLADDHPGGQVDDRLEPGGDGAVHGAADRGPPPTGRPRRARPRSGRRSAPSGSARPAWPGTWRCPPPARSSSASSRPRPGKATPMLTVGGHTPPSTATSSASERRRVSAMRLDLLDRRRLVDDHDELVAAHATDHAGPPTVCTMRSASDGEEPVAGGVPRASLTSLNPSTSTYSTARVPMALGSRRAWPSRERMVSRLARPVSGSDEDRAASSSWWARVGRDVGDLDDEAAGRAVLVADGADREVAPQVGAVVADEALLDAVGVPAPGEQLLLEREIDGDVVRMGDVGQAQLSAAPRGRGAGTRPWPGSRRGSARPGRPAPIAIGEWSKTCWTTD